MRKILYALREIRAGQISDKRAPDEWKEKRLGESKAYFNYLDHELSGIRREVDEERVQEVMTSADFTFAIMEFVQRQALPGYMEMEFAFEPLVWNDQVPNFLDVTRYQRREGLPDMEYVGEKGRTREGHIPDAIKRQYRPYRFAKQYDFSFEALVNDDLGYFADTAADMGRTARRTLERYVSRFYTNATSIARLTGLGALYSQNGRLTSARVSESRMAFGQRTDASGNPINAGLTYVVYHRGLEDTVRQIQASQLVPENATNAANVVRSGWIGIKDPHMAGAAPNLPWWGFVRWQAFNIRPFVLARLDSWPGPKILRRRSDIEQVTSLLGPGVAGDPIMGDYSTMDVSLTVVDVWGTYIDSTEGNYFDFRGGYYSSGTAP